MTITVCVLPQEGLLCWYGLQLYMFQCMGLTGSIVEVILSEKWGITFVYVIFTLALEIALNW